MNMEEDAYRDCCFIIDVIVSNDDSTIQTVLNRPWIGDQGQVMKSSKGKLDVEIPVPYLLADNSHSVKIVANHIFYILNDDKVQRYGCTKADYLILKKDLG